MRHILVYVSGKYSAKDRDGISKNIDIAMDASAKIWDAGLTAICPHGNTAHLEDRCKNMKYDDYIDGDLHILDRCDAIFMLPNWEMSKGATLEKRHAEALGLPVFKSMDDLITTARGWSREEKEDW